MILPKEIQELKASVAKFIDREIIPVVNEYDHNDKDPSDLYRKCIDRDLYCMYMPKKYGGPELSKLAYNVLVEELARGDLGLCTSMSSTCLATMPVDLAGTPEQKDLWYETVKRSKFAGFCLTEADAGSDSGRVQTTAVRDGDDYILNGTKCFISNGALAGIYSVIASTDTSLGTKGLTALMVERDRPGVSIGKTEDKVGMRLSNTTEVVFENVRVPASNRLGEEGKGFKIAMQTLDASRPTVGAQGVGIAQRAMDEAIKYAKQRVQFGKPISALQAVQFLIADMAIDIECSRQVVYHACSLLDAGIPCPKEAAISKTKGSDTAMQATVNAIQIFGGYGYLKDYPVEKLMRDAKILQIYEGTNQIQRVVIAGQLLK